MQENCARKRQEHVPRGGDRDGYIQEALVRQRGTYTLEVYLILRACAVANKFKELRFSSLPTIEESGKNSLGFFTPPPRLRTFLPSLVFSRGSFSLDVERGWSLAVSNRYFIIVSAHSDFAFSGARFIHTNYTYVIKILIDKTRLHFFCALGQFFCKHFCS